MSIVEADIGQPTFVSIYKRIDKTIDTSEIQKEISSRVREELDYVREQKHMMLFKNFFRSNNVVVPSFFSEYIHRKTFMYEYLEGKKLLDFKNKSHEVRKPLAKNMFEAWYYPFYKYGIIHGDPHLGNYSANNKLQINLLDFGCIRFFKSTFVKGVIDLYHSIMTKNEDLAVHAYKVGDLKKHK